MLVPDLVGRREDAEQVGKAVAAAYRAGFGARGLELPEAHRHAPFVPEEMLAAWKGCNSDTEAVLAAFLGELASCPAGAALSVAEVYARWEEMAHAAAARRSAT